MLKLLESALEQVSVGVLVAEAPGGRVVYANSRATELLVDDDDDGTRLLAVPIRQALAGVTVASAMVSRRRADGTLARYSVDATPLRAQADSSSGVTGVVIEVRDAVTATDAGECERLDPAHTRLLAALSHEVRTPLTAVVGYSDLLDAELAGPLTAAQRHQVERIRSSAWQTISVLEQTLAYASAGAGSLDLQRERVDLCEVVREAALLHHADAERRGIRITCELPAAPVMVETDAARVRQIVAHLVANAVTFTSGRRVRIIGRRGEDGFRTVVHDDGPGIEAHKRAVIFELFQRDGVQHCEAAGTGVGLALSRQLARLLGGELSLEEGSGRGTRFVLDLPAGV